MDPVKPDNVTSITRGKKKDTPKKADMYKDLADFINGKPSDIGKYSKLEDFPNRYQMEITADKSVKLLIEKKDQTVQYCSDDCFKSDVLKFCIQKLHFHEYYNTFIERSASEFFNFWRLYTNPITEPIVLGLKSYEGLCFTRTDFNFDFDFGPDDYKVFDELLGHNHNYLAVKYFLGSLFDPNADIQQVLVLYGEGMNGKSTMLNFLCRCLGEAVASSMAPDKNNMKNFTAQFVGKRLGIFPDAENLNFLQSQQFKMMTGGDLIAIDEKYEKVYNKRLSCKFIISSNHKPTLKGQKSDSRRLVYYEMPEVAEPDPKFLERLYTCRKGIFCHLIDMYYEEIGKGNTIPVESDQLDGLLDENTVDEAAFFDRYFEIEAGARMSIVTIHNCVFDHFGKAWPGRRKFMKSFDLWLRRNVGCDKVKAVRFGSKIAKGYCNFKLQKGNSKLACTNTMVTMKEELDGVL